MGQCKGICERNKVQNGGRKSEYNSGKKFCTACKCFFIVDKKFCQCCGTQLRIKPHYNYLRRKKLEIARMKREREIPQIYVYYIAKQVSYEKRRKDE